MVKKNINIKIKAVPPGKLIRFCTIILVLFSMQSPAYSDEVSHVYDDLGRLSSTLYKDGYTITQITYNYGGVGNLETRQVAIVIQDTDEDSIPDGWEIQYGLDPDDSSDAALDSDGDGLTNLEEYESGTDPTFANTDQS